MLPLLMDLDERLVRLDVNLGLSVAIGFLRDYPKA